jgi:hypothetical protein
MTKICYIPKDFKPPSLEIIQTANAIIIEYQAQGFDLTLRQLYYQFVARGLIANKDTEYKRLGNIISDARLAGLISWEAIVDRTRYIRSNSHWSSPASIMRGAANGYAIDKWARQPYHIEVWIEKDALVGVFEPICEELDIGLFSCRGYTSQSEMWAAAMRLKRVTTRNKRTPLILHFGDHDPSGMDMTRDIRDRLELFMGGLEVDRLALTWDQVEEYTPPPNPAKITDSRAGAYIIEYGEESWELDALEPQVLSDLVRNKVYEYRDVDLWAEAVEEEENARKVLTAMADNWDDVKEYVEEAFPMGDEDDDEGQSDD